MSETKQTTKKIYCNSCRSETNHILKGEYDHSSTDEEDLYWVQVVNRLWICAGCEAGTFETAYTDEDMSIAPDVQAYEYTYYPARESSALTAKTFARLPPELANIYKESIGAFNMNALVLCSAGLRALLEGICQDKKCEGKTLQQRIDGLLKHLPNKNIVKNLHHFRFTGNRAIHELEAPKKSDVQLAINVLEDLMNFFYELDYKASRLRASSKKPRNLKTSKAGRAPLLITEASQS